MVANLLYLFNVWVVAIHKLQAQPQLYMHKANLISKSNTPWQMLQIPVGFQEEEKPSYKTSRDSSKYSDKKTQSKYKASKI